MENLLNFETNFGKVRTLDLDGKVYFVGKDVAKALGYSEPHKAVSRHCRGGIKHPVPTTSGIQDMLIITEGDLYRLVTHSKLPNAEEFEKIVFDDILPSIRQNGFYMRGKDVDLFRQMNEYEERLQYETDRLVNNTNSMRELIGSKKKLSCDYVRIIKDYLGIKRIEENEFAYGAIMQSFLMAMEVDKLEDITPHPDNPIILANICQKFNKNNTQEIRTKPLYFTFERINK